ncbi:ribosomal protein L36 [Cystobasidiomycetes sp. EMM_F5]
MAYKGYERKDVPVGMSRGHPTTKREEKQRPSLRKGKASKRHVFVKSLVREVVGFAPYERRLMELLRNGQDKKARRTAKARLGTLRRAKRKIDEVSVIIAESRRAH